MQLNPYLHFNGNCEEAIKFYETALGAKTISLTRFAGTPGEGQVPGDWKQKVIHARFAVQGQTVLCSDAPPGRYSNPQGFSMSIIVNDPAEGERLFTALAERGKTIMPFAKTFWSPGFGMCIDQFGIPWMVNCE